MFCINCGKPIDDGKLFCDACAPAEEKPAAPAEQPQPAAETPVVAEETIELGGTEPAKKTKKPRKAPKKGLIIGIAAAIVVAAGACTAIWWDYVSNFFVKTFSSPEDYMAHVTQNAADEGIGALGDVYGTILDSMSGKGEKPQYNGMDMTMEVTVGDQLLNLLKESAGADIDLDFLKKIAITTKVITEADNMKSQVDASFSLGGVKIATISAIANMQDFTCILGSPELSDSYMRMDYSEIFEQLGAPSDFFDQLEENMDEAQEIVDQLMKALPKQEAMEQLLTKYVNLIVTNIKDVTSTTETVEVGDLKQSLTVLEIKISAKDAADIAIAVLQELKKDNDALELVTAFAEYANSISPSEGEWIWDETKGDYVWVAAEFDADEFKDGLKDQLEELVDQLKDAKKEMPSTSVKLTMYVDGVGDIVGLNAKVPGAEFKPGFITVWQGNKFAFEADLGEAKIEGEGSRSKGLITGKFTLKVEKEKVCTLEIENWDEKKAEEGYISGTIRFIPGEMITEQLMGSVSSFLDASSIALELQLDTAEDHANVSISLLLNKKVALGLSMKGTMINGTIKEPSNVVDATSSNAVMEWANSLDIDKVLENLEKAGFPVDELLGGRH